MGSPEDQPGRDADESPLTVVDLRAFEMDRSPVTVADFEAQMPELQLEASEPPWFLEEETPEGWLGRCNLGSTRKNHPVTCVTWSAARAYCKALGGDLPTEAEWEYASRAGRSSAYQWGADFDGARAVSSVECSDRGCRGTTEAVVTSGDRCNSWGLCDLSGNVWEWTLTDYEEQLGPYVNEVTMDSIEQPIHRGGSWLNENPRLFRSAQRGLNYPGHGLTGIGFRCVWRAR